MIAKYAANHSTQPDLELAIDAICEDLARQLGGSRPDISFLFLSHAHAPDFEGLAERVMRKSGTRHLLGCTGESVAGGGEEIEHGPVVSLWSAVLPDAELDPFHLRFTRTPDGIACSGIPPIEGENPESVRAVFLFGEPFSSVPGTVIDRFAEEHPGVALVGGMASGAVESGKNRLFLDSATIADGAVGAVLRGGPRIRLLVSQGCRPIGEHYLVTSAEGNVIHALRGASPLQRLNELLPSVSEEDQRSLQGGLHVGIAMDEYREAFTRGDFLVSNVIGIQREQGSLVISREVRVGQTVQFHVRDATTADHDLVRMLREDEATSSAPAGGALLFICNGRGTRLFPLPHHDAATIQREVGPIPLAGFFAQGELGPVGGENYLHGFTASVALFES